jgi:hypothetical protein
MELFRYILGAFAVLTVCLFASRVDAQEQEHLQVGVFADYFNTSQTSTSSFGVGGRLAVPVFWGLKLEGEMAYDSDRVFTEGFGSIDNPPTCGFCTVSLGQNSIWVMDVSTLSFLRKADL